MVVLKRMSDKEFTAWWKNSVASYAREKVKAGNFKEETAIEQSESEFQKLLPQGKDTPDHYLFTVIDEGEHVGMLWFHANHEIKENYIFDIEMLESKRAMGYGKQTLQALEELSREMGMDKISLHVFGHNKTAIELYTATGFETTNIIMSKQL
ncbi:GNAT family N-acetyltransferase [Rossellomorea marisflavi]|uniref:GNAT family N-acetyltransferase n=1 Tax=Rossellomorea marisflavi TaxID=189381 RepID=UPI00207A1627|nr:GNAT family N-acetyltransferase [Rossellomorea marisflavi]USK90234.1 GNAT family N-acetyltransferase [Rossellomorea marisflavi]